jgi:hypothetical protein
MRRILPVLLATFMFAFNASAVPSQIIILRHGEKLDSKKHGGFELCGVGVARSLALVQRYLGKGADASLFTAGNEPVAFLAITLHTIELGSPSAQSWGLPLTAYSAVPIKGSAWGDSEAVLDLCTQQAANDVLTNPAWNGKTVVMVWEHKHIADKKLAGKNPPVTLRELLHLDALNGVPKTWEGSNYDYFWVVTYGNAGSTTPTAFQTVKQDFSNPAIPDNDWGQPENLPKKSGCKQ